MRFRVAWRIFIWLCVLWVLAVIYWGFQSLQTQIALSHGSLLQIYVMAGNPWFLLLLFEGLDNWGLIRGGPDDD